MLAGSVSMVAYPMQQLAAFRRTERRQSYGLRIKACAKHSWTTEIYLHPPDSIDCLGADDKPGWLANPISQERYGLQTPYLSCDGSSPAERNHTHQESVIFDGEEGSCTLTVLVGNTGLSNCWNKLHYQHSMLSWLSSHNFL